MNYALPTILVETRNFASLHCFRRCLLDVMHPPAVATSLSFALKAGNENNARFVCASSEYHCVVGWVRTICSVAFGTSEPKIILYFLAGIAIHPNTYFEKVGIPQFIERYPDLKLNVSLNNRIVDV